MSRKATSWVGISEVSNAVSVRWMLSRSWIARRFGPALSVLGWTSTPSESDEVRLRRAALLRLVGGVAEAPDVLAESRRRLDGYLAERGSLEPNLADSVVALAARVGDAALYERYRTVAADARTPQEQRRFLLNLSSFRAREASGSGWSRKNERTSRA